MRRPLVVSEYPELFIVLIAVAIGICLQSPLKWLASRQGIDVLLIVLVFSTALTIEPQALRRASASWRPLVFTLIVGASILPLLSWLVSRLISAGSLRDGVMSVGLAPCEIASVTTTAIAKGEAALSASVLIGSTVLTVVVAGPILAIEAHHSSVHPGHIIANLVLVVALPLVAGLTVSAVRPIGNRGQRAALNVATLSVAGLVALISAEIHVSMSYFAVAVSLLLFLAVSVLIGRIIGRSFPRPIGASILLTTSMRDFAIAASLATAAFGPAAAAPLGLYGVLVLLWGTAAAGWLRRK